MAAVSPSRRRGPLAAKDPPGALKHSRKQGRQVRESGNYTRHYPAVVVLCVTGGAPGWGWGWGGPLLGV